MLQAIISMLIQAVYEGGPAAFEKDFSTFFTADNRFVIAPKGDKVLPENLKEKLIEMGSGMNFTVVVAARSNFEGFSPEDQGPEFNEYMVNCEVFQHLNANIQGNSAMIDIFTEIRSDSDVGKQLIEELDNYEHINNYRIQFQDKTVFRCPEEGSEVEPKASKLATGRPERDAVISEDDITNLTIDLGRCETVEDFLAMM